MHATRDRDVVKLAWISPQSLNLRSQHALAGSRTWSPPCTKTEIMCGCTTISWCRCRPSWGRFTPTVVWLGSCTLRSLPRKFIASCRSGSSCWRWVFSHTIFYVKLEISIPKPLSENLSVLGFDKEFVYTLGLVLTGFCSTREAFYYFVGTPLVFKVGIWCSLRCSTSSRIRTASPLMTVFEGEGGRLFC